jgi:hypothetical protein
VTAFGAGSGAHLVAPDLAGVVDTLLES